MLAFDLDRRYNRDLTPVFANVATAGSPPTPAQLRLVFWAHVIHGARGIAWFHYFGETLPENRAEMARCLDLTTRLTPVICGRTTLARSRRRNRPRAAVWMSWQSRPRAPSTSSPPTSRKRGIE